MFPGRFTVGCVCIAVFWFGCQSSEGSEQLASNIAGELDASVTPAADATAATSEPTFLFDAGATQVDSEGSVVDSNAPTTYQRNIRPLLEANCVECHSQGGIAPAALDDFATVSSLGALIVQDVMSGEMPPWPASDACRPIADSRALSAADKALFEKWQADGFLEGDPTDYVPPARRARPDLGAPTLTLKGDEPFTPGRSVDTFRCFFLGTVDSDTYLTGLDIVPLERAEVHHAQLHRVKASDVAAVKNADKNAAGGGYGCNSAGVGSFVSSQNLFSYRPGALAVSFQSGDAAYIEAGSGLVLQIHYNTQFLPQGESPKPDQTRVNLWTMPEGSTPERVIYRTGLLSPLGASSKGDRFLTLTSVIPAFATDVVGETDLPMRNVAVLGSGLNLGAVNGKFVPGEIMGITPHAHTWATRLAASLTPQGRAAQCLLEVPHWDYDWQLDYLFVDGVPYGPDDQLHVECNFDNSPENQPVIDGVKQPSDTISFGQNTLNEMCEHYLWLRLRYEDFAAARR